MTMCLYLPDGTRGLHVPPAPRSRPTTPSTPPGCASRWSSPSWSSGSPTTATAVVLDDPVADGRPRAAFTSNPHTPCAVPPRVPGARVDVRGRARPARRAPRRGVRPGPLRAAGGGDGHGARSATTAGSSHGSRSARPQLGAALLAGTVVLPLAHGQRREGLRLHGLADRPARRRRHPGRLRLGRRHACTCVATSASAPTWDGDAHYHRRIEAELVTDDRTWACGDRCCGSSPCATAGASPDGRRARHPHLRRASRGGPSTTAGSGYGLVGVPRPDRRRVTGRPGRIGPWTGPRSTSTRSAAASGRRITRRCSVTMRPGLRAGRVAPGALRIDLGCGAGRYTRGPRAPRSSASTPLGPCSTLCRRRSSRRRCSSRRDLEALPFGPGIVARRVGAHELPPRAPCPASRARWPICTAPSSSAPPSTIQVLAGDYEGARPGRGRPSAAASSRRGRRDGSATSSSVPASTSSAVEVEGDVVRARAVRARTLPDVVGPGMRLLVVGLNPSVYSADVGVGYARPGQPLLARGAGAPGLVTRDRDPVHALRAHGVGMTDLVKRATANAASLTRRGVPGRHGTGRTAGAVARARRRCASSGLSGMARRRRPRARWPGVQPQRSADDPCTSCRRRVVPTRTLDSTRCVTTSARLRHSTAEA